VLIFVAALGAFAGYAAMSCSFDTLDLTNRFGIFRCLAGFAIGVAGFELKSRGGLRKLDSLSIAAISAVEVAAVAATMLVLSVVTGQWSALAVPVFAILILVFQKDGGMISRLLARDWPQALGRLSYSFYLVHVPIRIVGAAVLVKLGVPAIRNAADQQILQVPLWIGDLMIIVFIAIALLVSSVTFRTIEEPARMFGRSWRKREIASGVGQI
jgi:peptidoglycan/LPS O-acetylase OafA/YrhL